MLPDGWKKATLGELLPKSYRNGIYKDSSYYGSGTRILRITDFDGDGRLSTCNLLKVDLSIKEVESFELKDSDIIINRVNSLAQLGKAILWERGFGPAVYESNMMRIEPASELLDPKFLIRILLSQAAKKYFRGVAKQAVAQCSINQQDVKKMPILLPPLPEQNKVAKILTAWDRAIGTTEHLLNNSQRQKKALMQQLLSSKQRLPGFSSRWQVVKFGEAFRERGETGFIELPLLSITSEEGVINREDSGRKDTSNADKSKYLRICPGDIGYNTMRMWQGVSGLSTLEGLVSPAYTVLVPQPGVYPLFAAYLFKLPALVHVFYRHSQGLVSDTWNLKYANFSKIQWSIPGFEEQKAIAAVLSSADREIETLQQQLAGLNQEKKVLMQQLLTGKRRVSI